MRGRRPRLSLERHFRSDAVARMGTALQGFSRRGRQRAWTTCKWRSAAACGGSTTIARNIWSAEVRRGGEQVNQCRLQLQQAMTYRRVADHQPTCIDEKRALAAAKRRLQVAQEKLEAVRHWSRVIDRAVDEYRAGRAPLAAFLDGDLPRALARAGPHDRGAGGLRGPGNPRRSGRGRAVAPGKRRGDSPMFADARIGTVAPGAGEEPPP